MELYFVTSNREKVKEFIRILGKRLNIHYLEPRINIKEIESQDVRRVAVDKAIKYSRIFKKSVMAEDTGLFIHALGGFPGSLIRRETEKHGGDFGYWCELLNRMGVKDRSAHAETAIAVRFLNGRVRVYTGRTDGYIAKKPMKGEYGFGWDSIFIPKGYGKTFACMTPDEKDMVSMRRKAIEKLLKNKRLFE